MRYFASVSRSNILFVRQGSNYSQYFKKAHGGDTVEMVPISKFDYRAIFHDGRVTVIPKDKLPGPSEGWVCMPKMYFPSKGDWSHMETDPLKQEEKKQTKRRRKMTLAEMLEEMDA